jgi:hypothetical protein
VRVSRGFCAVLALGTLTVAIQPARPALAQGAPCCRPGKVPQFGFGFASLKARLGPIMGEPVECAHPNSANGDVLRKTTTGLSCWRQSTNTPTFTDGWRHRGLTPGGMVAWEGAGVEPAAAATASAAGGMGPFTGQRVRHGFGLTILPDGRGDAEWRLHRWSHETGGREPCDRIVGGRIIGGGRARMDFSPPGRGGGDGTTLRGRIGHSTAPWAVPIGPVALRLGPFGTGEFQAGAEVLPPCGPRFDEAPDWFKRTTPCGA